MSFTQARRGSLISVDLEEQKQLSQSLLAPDAPIQTTEPEQPGVEGA